MHPDPVTTHPTGRGEFQQPRQLAIVGQHQQAFGLDIQPAHCDNARHVLGKILEHGCAATHVAGAGDMAARLVITPQPRHLDCRDWLAVDPDAAFGVDGDRRRFKHLAVDGDSPSLDPALGVPP